VEVLNVAEEVVLVVSEVILVVAVALVVIAAVEVLKTLLNLLTTLLIDSQLFYSSHKLLIHLFTTLYSSTHKLFNCW
jgi:hypothetical protein